MVDMKNNPLLEKLIEHSKALGGSANATLTAERYVVSVIDFVTDPTTFDATEEDKRVLLNLLVMHMPFAGLEFAEVKEHFLNHIENNKSTSYIDGIYMQQHMYKAKEAAKSKGLETLTPEVLLECIFSDPNDFIKEVLSTKSKLAPETMGDVMDDTASLTEGISTRFDELFAQEVTDETVSKETVKEDVKEKKINPKSAVAKLTQKVKSTHDALVESIYGQDNAVSIFTTGYFQAELRAMTDKKRTRPRATFLFAGPPGVGKTFLAEKAAEILGLPFMRFDMSEYSDKEANLEFCGSDKVYKGAKEGNVTGFVAKYNKCVLLFDEIEKAHINIIHLFLQILDAGRLRDNFTDREVSFTNAIIIFTTNAGKQLYENSDANDFSGVTRKVILKALQNDVNAETEDPFFPAAICSRFASGNVVMFNHITAHNLREIAKKEVLRHAKNFESEIGIKVDIDEQVYTALLFAEGGAADARTIRSRAETFFDDELFELFRLIASEKVNSEIDDLESISISVDLPSENKELMDLFANKDNQDILVFSSKETAEQCKDKCPNVKFVDVQSIESAKGILHNSDICFILIDLTFGHSKDSKYLNIEDVESASRDFFWFIREHYADMPIYILQHPDKKLNAEEQLSFLRQGVRGVITLTKNEKDFSAEINDVVEKLYQQRSMSVLARGNKLVTFETAQTIRKKGKTAEIKLFDFKMTVAIDAEDSKNILSNVSKPDVRFDQVIGAEDAKKELRYFVEYMKNPKRYLGSGVSAPKGVLLYGPPGTGKTMLAKAMASESNVTFITAEGNQFLKKYVGEGPDKVHELFRTAHKYAPSILFIDEIDAIAKERKGGDGSEGTEATLTAFLTEMDGFKNDATRPVFVLAATNFDVEPGGDKSLDPALMRRFDRRVYIDLPNRDERIRYMRMRFEGNNVFELSEEKIDNIAIRSTGMSLAELASVIELSLRTAIRDGNLKVTDDIFEEAFETFNCGEKKHWNASQLERVARHEAGHTFLCWQSGETPSYVTIVARGNHGYMQHDDNEGKAIYTKDELLAKIRTSLGGRASEIVYYGEKDGISTGASGDLVSATNIAHHIICTYGMDEKFGLAVIDQQAARDSELSGEVREAVNKILSDEMKKAIKLIEENKQAIDALVEKLLSNNHLTGSEITDIFERNAAQTLYR